MEYERYKQNMNKSFIRKKKKEENFTERDRRIRKYFKTLILNIQQILKIMENIHIKRYHIKLKS